MDELVDILDSEGNMTGKTALKSVVHQKGLCHQTVHIWFYTSDGKVLLQQRGKDKETHPMLWDVSVAGHIGAGEAIETAAIREIQEEIGLTVSAKKLQKIGFFPSFFKHNEGLIDNEFHHSFICELKEPLKSLQKQESEVRALQLVTIDEFKMVLGNKESPKRFVPHEGTYYERIIDEIEKIIATR